MKPKTGSWERKLISSQVNTKERGNKNYKYQELKRSHNYRFYSH